MLELKKKMKETEEMVAMLQNQFDSLKDLVNQEKKNHEKAAIINGIHEKATFKSILKCEERLTSVSSFLYNIKETFIKANDDLEYYGKFFTITKLHTFLRKMTNFRNEKLKLYLKGDVHIIEFYPFSKLEYIKISIDKDAHAIYIYEFSKSEKLILTLKIFDVLKLENFSEYEIFDHEFDPDTFINNLIKLLESLLGEDDKGVEKVIQDVLGMNSLEDQYKNNIEDILNCIIKNMGTK